MYEKLFDENRQNNMRNFFLNSVSKMGRCIDYTKNEVVKKSDINEIMIVISGKIKVCTFTSSGIEKVLFYLREGEINGEVSYFVGNHIEAKVVSMEDSTISYVNYDDIDSLLEHNPEYHAFFIHSIVRKYQIALSQINDFLAEGPKVRLASTLYRLCAQIYTEEKGIKVIDLTFTHQELANLMGCSRVTITRTLQELKDDGIIDVKNKKIHINDIEKLKALAGI
ncbi:Crp/Fnr family transcriptional regulator [Clostridium ihumii]|uniref:Crp/Fnr family transcriptional regulator n=1 Tax=Clostridium ihumii TaxID=1470356 RepID=UPI00058FEA1E|nr:Crp/Fnr family transcriptional regulator [Clostridium ihumii]